MHERRAARRAELLAELMEGNPRAILHRLSNNAMEALLAGTSYDPLGLQSSDSDVGSEGSDEHSYFDSASANGSGLHAQNGV